MPAVRLYLASTSPARLATLRAAGVEPIAIPPGVDEEAAAAAAGPLPPAELVLLLARLKAEAVAADPGLDGLDGLDGLVLGGDSAFEFEDVVYGKPHLAEVARERWRAQRGRAGVLHSGHWLIDTRSGRSVGAPAAAVGVSTSARVEFAEDIDDAEIEAYLATGEPLQVAGAFTIDARGGAFISRIDGDPHTVVGLSIPAVRKLVRSLGVAWTDLWDRD